MIRGSIYAAVVAMLLSLVVHGLGLGVASRQPQPSPVEESAGDLADVGAAFEDFAETITALEDPAPALTPDPADVTPPERAIQELPTSQALVASDNPQNVTVPDTGPDEVIEPDAVAPSQSDAPAPEAVERSGGEDNVTMVTTAETASLSSPETDPSPSTASIPEPDMPDPEQPSDPETEAAEAREVASGSAVTRSLRPPKERPTQPVPGMPDAVQQEDAERAGATGTIESPVTSYKRTGIDPFAAIRSTAGRGATGFSGSRGPGNASETNYAGQVLVRLNRFPAVRPSARGVAQVSFEINPDGTVAWINILSSTGSPDIRRAASDQVRRAAPFPPPPDGTSQRLVFTYQRK